MAATTSSATRAPIPFGSPRSRNRSTGCRRDPQQADPIVDFTQGQDRIDLSLIDANVSLDGDQSFTFLADPAHYTGDWSGLVWQTTDSRTGIATLNVSIDADPGADMQIYMSHPYTFTANDFIL